MASAPKSVPHHAVWVRPTPRLSLRWPRCGVALISLVLVWLIFSITLDRFFTMSSLANIAAQSTVLLLLSVGQLFALLVRGFDISVGAVAALASTAAAIAFNEYGVVGLAAGPLVGLAVGTINGLLIAKFDVQPIVATLGTLVGAQGVALLISDNGQVVVLSDPQAVIWLAYGDWLGMAPMVWLSLGAALGAWLVLSLTVPGRRLLMLGSNPEAASLVGMTATRVHMTAYQITGLFASTAGLVMLIRAGAGLPTDGTGMELQSIASAVIGGTALSGGVASVPGAVLGAGFIQSLISGLNISGTSPFSAEIAIGAVIIAASSVSMVPRLWSRVARWVARRRVDQ